MRMALKRDANHEEIRDAFLVLGWGWTDTWRFSRGFPDGIALSPVEWGQPRVAVLIEVKGAYRTLTEAEGKFLSAYRGPWHIARNREDVEMIDCIYAKAIKRRDNALA